MVVLYYLHGMSLVETAEALGIALGTVKSRLHYALHALRVHLAAERPEPGTPDGTGILAPGRVGDARDGRRPLMGRARAGCRRHRSALTAFAAHREAAPETRPALDHVDRCRACADELQELVLAVIALRRLGELPEPAAISSAAWPRLRDRIERTRASAAALAWRSRTTLAGMAAGTLLVAAIVAPLALNVPLGDTSAEPAG